MCGHGFFIPNQRRALGRSAVGGLSVGGAVLLPAHRVLPDLRSAGVVEAHGGGTVSTAKGGEVVMSGGVALDEVNSKTMESKLVPDLYFCGEVLDIDGFCGGFNLQNCWSTGFLAAEGLLAKL